MFMLRVTQFTAR